ncbi:MAG: hypothetical protein J2P37_02160 [Ktedonobacteraceae bacterium]|nr:hypothetical protein [Ktedonobacteraceae bacterium]MBO0789338.1 hypothetical protein [Ktedonobacteraceae bacterium]
MNSSQPTRAVLLCPVCGAEPPYRTWTAPAFGNSGFKLDSPRHPFLGAEVSALVCTVCGYVQFFVNPQDFRD